MREIKYNEEIQWMAGYNIYNKVDSNFRYVYGYSYESDLRNADVVILAEAQRLVTLGVASLAAIATSLLF